MNVYTRTVAGVAGLPAATAIIDFYTAVLKGWEIGIGPTVVVIDEGVAKSLSTSSLKDAYAFIFNQQGLMAGIGIEGTKVSRINR